MLDSNAEFQNKLAKLLTPVVSSPKITEEYESEEASEKASEKEEIK